MSVKLSEHWREVIFGIGTVALCLVLESIFSRLYEETHLEWWWIFIIVAIAALPAVVAAMLYAYFLQKSVDEQAAFLQQSVEHQAAGLKRFNDDISADIRTIVEHGLSERELRAGAYLTDTAKIREIERNAHEIWVITPDFYWDSKNNEYSQIVDQNISEGKSYTYFCPDTPASKDDVAEIAARTSPDHAINVSYVPQEAFGITHFEFVIYDPDRPATQRGILVDLLGTRTTDPKNSIDLFLDSTNLLPRLLIQVKRWKTNFPPQVLKGTRS